MPYIRKTNNLPGKLIRRSGISTCLTIIFCLAILHGSFGQGCSDAGFCTMGAMRPDQPFNKKIPLKLRALEFNFYRGKTTLSPVLYVGTIDFTIGIFEKSSFQVKLPYYYVKGNLGETNGIGDISLAFTRVLSHSEKWDLNATIGAKIPSNKSNLENNDTGSPRDYPMYYQTSLGSFDFIAGTSLISRNWLFATGVQIALTHNENFFRWSEWPEYPNQDYIRKHPLAKQLKRGTDIMFRVERNFRFSRFNASLGLLPIYRITRDEILDEPTGLRKKEPGTTGLALTAILGLGYQFNVNSSIKFMYGKKITDRELNPDGLTRHDVYSFSYVYRF